VSVALGSSTDDESLAKYKATLTDLTGAKMTAYKDDYCDVKSFNYYNEWEEAGGGSQGQNVFFKMVYNKHYQDITVNGVRGMDVKSSVSAWTDYVGKVMHDGLLWRPPCL
jgi:hypothetical protein